MYVMDCNCDGSACVEATLRPTAGLRVGVELSTARTFSGGIWRHITLSRSETAGRFVTAARRLERGTVVCESPAYALVPAEEWKKRVCAACFSVTHTRLTCACPICEQAFYCSESCRAGHLKQGSAGSVAHSLLCPALKRFSVLKRFGKSNMAVWRLVLEVLARATLIPCTGASSASFEASFESLVHHPPKWLSQKEAMDFKRSCSSFRTALAACEWADAQSLTDEHIYALMSRLDSNCFGYFAPQAQTAPPQTAVPQTGGASGDCLSRPSEGHLSRPSEGPLVAQGCYLAAAVFNHSCAPNCSALCSVGPDARTMRVVLDEAVAAGSELCIAYTDTNAPLAARRSKLLQGHCFECACPRCREEGAIGSTKVSYAASSQRGAARSRARRVELREEQRARDRARAKELVKRERQREGQGGDQVPWFEALA